ncbi:InlB B-repeat-containing protein [Thalassobellus suaedae]|uniref:Family 16 glycosylhydrolase n=1 Tax=Thalassobellus suaedae TaxID=3074124 RepID=A0ABY9Y137_9FLAO|nr:family 16 glycosylhydrolase [Flavobacteriaceae bacterium HL-DH10]
MKNILLLLSLLSLSCSKEDSKSDEPVQFSLTTTVTPQNSGTVTPATGNFVQGTTINIEATAKAGYLFTGWSGDASGDTNPLPLKMDANKNVVANFVDTSTLEDWYAYEVPADAGTGKTWVLQSDVSDDFNYVAIAGNKGADFDNKWTDWYHNAWTGPGLTNWNRENSFVENGMLKLIATRKSGTNKVYTGAVTSKKRIQYPVYIETRAKIMNSVLANGAWLLSPDDTQEIDFMEAYGSSYSEGAAKDQTYFAERMHLSHHVFIRQPFQDYQPTDAGSWYKTSPATLWRNDFHRYGVHWIDPWNLKYYVDGVLVRTVSGKSIIDPNEFTNGTGLNKEMDILFTVEDQDWRSNQGITPTDNELSNLANNTFSIDWVRVYKPN